MSSKVNKGYFIKTHMETQETNGTPNQCDGIVQRCAQSPQGNQQGTDYPQTKPSFPGWDVWTQMQMLIRAKWTPSRSLPLSNALSYSLHPTPSFCPSSSTCFDRLLTSQLPLWSPRLLAPWRHHILLDCTLTTGCAQSRHPPSTPSFILCPRDSQCTSSQWNVLGPGTRGSRESKCMTITPCS